jgi:hypothetical protein
MTAPKAPAASVASINVASRQTLPHFELQQISPHGAVFRSDRACEPGTAFVFGIHLSSSRRGQLLDLEAVVVDCRAAGSATDMGWEVTLLFDSVTPDQELTLRAAARINLQHEPFPQHHAPFGHRGFHEPGLN